MPEGNCRPPDLRFEIDGAESVPFAATPVMRFKLRVTNVDAQPIHTVVLRAQIQIETTRRHYTEQEQKALLDLFGEPERWSRTLRSMLWTHATVTIPAFMGEALADLNVPCTFDFNVAATKYFHGLTEGELPLNFLFSGTVFYADQDGNLQVAPISWDKETKFSLPLQTWKQLIDSYYPNAAWLSLRRDVFERLYRYKVRNGVPTWEQAIERLLAAVAEPLPQ